MSAQPHTFGTSPPFLSALLHYCFRGIYIFYKLMKQPCDVPDLLDSDLRGRERWGRKATLLGKFATQQGCRAPEFAETAARDHMRRCGDTVCISCGFLFSDTCVRPKLLSV